MKDDPVQPAHHPPIEGDYAPYGFGHPAHKPDPEAKYGFETESGERRVLPVEPEVRWRVSG